MTRLTWPTNGSDRVETGLSQGVLYPSIGYSWGEVWPGLVSVNLSTQDSDFVSVDYNGVRLVNNRRGGMLKGSLSALSYPESFEPCLGERQLVYGVNVLDQPRSAFCLSYKVNYGANDYKIHMLYNLTISSPKITSQTQTNTVSADPIQFDFTIVPQPVDLSNQSHYAPSAHLVVDSKLVDPQALANFDAVFYGSSTEDAMLLLPNDIYDLLSPPIVMV